jgi:hypothetical protein
MLVQSRGWHGAFVGLIAATAVGALLFAAALPAKLHGGTEGPPSISTRG